MRSTVLLPLVLAATPAGAAAPIAAYTLTVEVLRDGTVIKRWPDQTVPARRRLFGSADGDRGEHVAVALTPMPDPQAPTARARIATSFEVDRTSSNTVNRQTETLLLATVLGTPVTLKLPSGETSYGLRVTVIAAKP